MPLRQSRPTSPDASTDQLSAAGSPANITVATRPPRDRLPLPSLLVFALLGFLLISTETMPAGILPQIATGMQTSEGMAGQLVSAYALGTVIVTIPAIVLTRGYRRKPSS
jgi:predicted MFS family arabinose efflux permease